MYKDRNSAIKRFIYLKNEMSDANYELMCIKKGFQEENDHLSNCLEYLNKELEHIKEEKEEVTS